MENCGHIADTKDRLPGAGKRLPTDFNHAVLSRTLERLVVRAYIYPALLQPCPSLDFSDQFASRPSGSTTAAIVALLHTVRTMMSCMSSP